MPRPPPPDGDTGLAQECYATVTTHRRGRGRFAESAVHVVATAAEALAAADPAANCFAARVYGPSPSSEGLRIYYLVQWLP
ncbi:MAG: hypothetical protein MUF66_02530 [Gammaproteobacteria bacterium]|jgi:hypothetical protein|nr:hypothetical protein [Gammaproteobacteria bacterium]